MLQTLTNTCCGKCGMAEMHNKKHECASTEDVLSFLTESNYIEGVYDEDSVQQALFAWRYLSTHKKITPDVIRETHRVLMLNQPLLPGDKGKYRKVMAYVAGRAGVKPNEIEEQVKNWCKYMNFKFSKKDDLEDITKKLHVQYEEIHPFIDGNGRTGRMFMNWQRLKLGLPILVIKASKRAAYYRWFK